MPIRLQKYLFLTLTLIVFSPAALAEMPSDADLQRVVDEAHARFKDVKEGANANYIPILDTVPSDLFGVVIVTREGEVFTAGDVDYRFSIQSVSKPFTAALVMAQQGPEAVREKIGVEPTGQPFNSKIAIEMYPSRSGNPLVNAGAIAAVSLVEAKDEDDRWRLVHDNIEGFAGSELPVLEEVYTSEIETAWSNRAIANLLSVGYPGEKIYYYRGGMQGWLTLGLTVHVPAES